MLTFDQFIAKWTGLGIDVDGFPADNPFQCMDLMHKYIVEVLGFTDLRILAAPSAKYVYLNYPNLFGAQYFDRIANTPINVPQKGDVILWDGLYGHVAVYKEGNVNSFISFDQNYPTGSKCHLQYHTYTNVLGWVRVKQAVKYVLAADILAVTESSGSDGDKLTKIRALCK